jgi:hypothetical protein
LASPVAWIRTSVTAPSIAVVSARAAGDKADQVVAVAKLAAATVENSARRLVVVVVVVVDDTGVGAVLVVTAILPVVVRVRSPDFVSMP